MITYENLKTWLGEKENKQKAIIGVCFVVVFFVGFGAGSFKRLSMRDTNKTYSNYTTQPAKKPLTAEAGTQADLNAAQPIVAGAATSTPATGACIVKGNISSTGSKIYHVKGGAFYDRVKPEQCFNTEAEAQAAGFRKSSR
jgi:hypothetical protein